MAFFLGKTSLSTPAHWYILLVFLAEPLPGIIHMVPVTARSTADPLVLVYVACVSGRATSRQHPMVPEVQPKKREFKHRGPTANFEYIWEKVGPRHPLSDKVFERLGT